MTRDDDRYLTLDDRAAVARRLDAALFVSLHMDSAPNPLARGATRLFAVRRRLGRGGRATGRVRECGGGRGDRSDGSVAGDALRPRDAGADERVGGPCRAAGQKSAGRFELRPNPHRFAAFHVLRRAEAPGRAVRGRLHQQCRRRSCCSARPSSARRSRSPLRRRSKPTSRRARAVKALTAFRASSRTG